MLSVYSDDSLFCCTEALQFNYIPFVNIYFYGVSLCCSGWSAVVQSRLTVSSASQVHTILLPQPPKLLGLQVPATTPG